MSKVKLSVVQEVACHLKMLRLFVLDPPDTVIIEQVDQGTRICHEDRRVARDDELRAFLFDQAAHGREKRELAHGGDCRLGLIEDVKTPADEASLHQAEEEGFAVATAEDGRAALDQLQRGLRPLLILLDLMMPLGLRANNVTAQNLGTSPRAPGRAFCVPFSACEFLRVQERNVPCLTDCWK